MIFVDTSAWYALADAGDRHHASARAHYARVAKGEFGRPVTTNYVQAETLTLMRSHLGLSHAEKLARTFDASKELRTIWIEPVHHREAIQMMLQHADREWSVFDCTSFVVMDALEIELAFSFDDDFSQAGFRTLSR